MADQINPNGNNIEPRLPANVKYIDHPDYADDLTEENCTPECWAYLNRPDNERKMELEDWQKLYQERLNSGYYENLPKKEDNDKDLPF